MSDPVQDAIAAAEAEIETNHAEGGGDGGNGGEQAPAEVTEALAKDTAELSDEDKTLLAEHKDSLTPEQITTLTEAGVLPAEGGGEELVLADVLEVEPADLDDAQKAFLVENQDDLTGKQIKALKEVGVEFEAEDTTKPVKTEPGRVDPAKPHEVPADDSDLVLEVEDAEGTVHKITKIGDLPSDFVYKDSRQPLEVIDGLNDLKAKKAERDKQRAENAEIDDSNGTRERVAQLWNSEFSALQAEGLLPEGATDWEKGEYGNAKIKEAAEGLFTFMTEENGRREKDGRPYVVSLRDVLTLKTAADASKKPQNQKTQAEIDAEAKAKKLKDEKARKIAAGNTDNGKPADDDKPSYVKGSGQTIGDITEQMIAESGK